MARISVIIPAYNAGRTLDLCIESIERQTWADWEIVACDDASTDDTWEILKRWAKRDARIILLRNGANRRAAAARNRCLELAGGEYVALQDADDYSSPGRLARQLEFLEAHPEYAFVGAAMDCFDEGGVWQRLEQKPAPEPRDFIWRMPFNHAAVMLRKSALDAVGFYRVARETARGQDLDLFMRLYAAGYRGYNLPDTLYYYNEDKENFGRRKYRYRIDEARVKWKGYRAMGVMPLGLPGVLKPLVVGLIPGRLMRRLKRWYFVLRRRMRRGAGRDTGGAGPARVLHVLASLGYGGVALMLFDFYRFIDRQRFQFDFVHYGREPAPYHADIERMGGRIIRIPPIREAGAFRYFRGLLRAMRQGGPYHAVHIHANYMAGIIALAARVCGIRMRICHIRGAYVQNRAVRPALPLMRLMIRLNATKRAAVSRESGRFYFGGAPFSVIRNAVDTERFLSVTPQAAGRLREELGIARVALAVGCVARFTREKNHRFLADVAGRLEETGRDFLFVFAGFGPLLEPTRELFRREGLARRALFLGNRCDVPALMRAFDATVLPSFSEGLPNAVMQAQAAGTPCVLSDGLTREVDIGLGLLYYRPLGDAQAWADAILRAAFAARPSASEITDAFRRNGFDIREAARALERMYADG